MNNTKKIGSTSSPLAKSRLIVSILAVLPVLILGINIIQNSPKTTLVSIAEVRN